LDIILPGTLLFLFSLKKWRRDEENGKKMVSLLFFTFAEDVGCL
jgi:hypothetical protein